jgi:hypothetical protein
MTRRGWSESRRRGQRGASVDVLNGKQETPVHLTAGDGRVETAYLLIDHGANLHTITLSLRALTVGTSEL